MVPFRARSGPSHSIFKIFNAPGKPTIFLLPAKTRSAAIPKNISPYMFNFSYLHSLYYRRNREKLKSKSAVIYFFLPVEKSKIKSS